MRAGPAGVDRRGLVGVAAVVAALTLTSRVVGFGRSLVFSKTVGDTCLGDAYNAANLLPNVLFETVAGGVLAGVVVPVVARHAGAGRRSEAARTSSALLTWTLLVLTPAALLAWLGASRYAAAFGTGSCPGEAAALAALLVMFVPQVWFYGLAVVSAGVLQAHSRFVAAAAGPLLSSLVVITAYRVFAAVAPVGAATDLARLGSGGLRALGWGTTLGVVALALTTVVPLTRLGLRLRPALRFAQGDAGVIARIAAAGLAGLVMQQLSLLLVSWAAKQTADPGALTRYSWANAVYLLPFAVLVAPLLQLVFPRLTAAAERGTGAVRGVLSAVAAPVVVLSGLGAALLVATAVPVARVFVLGPGSGRTDALAGPIAAFAPAVVGFALLGLASRTLLAQHLARAAGLTTVVAWGVVIVAVLVLRLLVPPDRLVVALAAAVSFGMAAGAAVGWALVHRSPQVRGRLGLTRPLAVTVAAALPAAALVGGLSLRLRDAGLGLAVLGASGCALACGLVFAGLVALLDRRLLARVLALRSLRAELDPVRTDS